MKNLRQFILTFTLTLMFLPLCAREKADSVYEFRFVSGKDMFFSRYSNNGTELV